MKQQGFSTEQIRVSANTNTAEANAVETPKFQGLMKKTYANVLTMSDLECSISKEFSCTPA
jgi:hypothetical protein